MMMQLLIDFWHRLASTTLLHILLHLLLLHMLLLHHMLLNAPPKKNVKTVPWITGPSWRYLGFVIQQTWWELGLFLEKNLIFTSFVVTKPPVYHFSGVYFYFCIIRISQSDCRFLVFILFRSIPNFPSFSK